MNRSLFFLEALEDRIAPASLLNLVNASTVSYNEADGDQVTVKFSKNVFAGDTVADLSHIFFRDNFGTLLQLDLTSIPSDVVKGTDITITVKKGVGGDGLADIGEIDADNSLGNVKIAGNLTSINIHNSDFAPLALKSLTVDSMVNPHINADRTSSINGNIGDIAVKGDIAHVVFNIGRTSNDAKVGSFAVGGNWTSSTLAVGISPVIADGGADGLYGTNDDRPYSGISSIGSLTIGGQIIDGGGQNYGIEAGSFGKIMIDHVDHSTEFSALEAYAPLALTGVTTVGQGGVFAVRVAAPTDLVGHTLLNNKTVVYNEIDGDLVTVKLSKPIFTGDNAGDLDSVFTFDSDTGAIQSIDFANLTDPTVADGVGLAFTVKKGAYGDGVAGDVQSIHTALTLGTITGIHNLDSIDIDNTNLAALALKSLSVHSMVWDGTGDTDSEIAGNVGTVTVKGDFSDLRFHANGSQQGFTIGGDLLGGDNTDTGLHLGSSKTITVGNIIGSSEDGSAQIQVDGNVGSITAGNLHGGDGSGSGSITIGGVVTTAKLGDLNGGVGDGSGAFHANRAGTVTAGDLTGSVGGDSGSVKIDSTLTTAKLGALQGGSGSFSGYLEADRGAGSVTAASITAGGSYAGGIYVENDYGAETSITITGNVNGLGSNGSEIIYSLGNIKTLTIGGSVSDARFDARNFGDIKISGMVSTDDAYNGFYANTIKSLSALSLSGTSAHHLNIATPGDTGDGYTLANVTIGSIKIAGDVAYTDINAGYAFNDEKVTSLTINGDWHASSFNVGIGNVGLSYNYGSDNTPYTGDDFAQGTPRVGSLTIKGAISGTSTMGENFGIRASVFEKVVFGKTKIDAIAAYAANEPTAISTSGGTLGNGAVFIERIDPNGLAGVP